MERSVKVASAIFSVVFLIMLCAGCASIVAGGPQVVPIKSHPSDAKVTIINMRTMNEIAVEKTPYTVTLDRGAGYFRKGMYKVVVEKEGYEKKEISLEGSPNGWYIGGNIIFGGLIGWLIVDPLTGAMWTLYPKDISMDLKEQVSRFQQGQGLTIVLTTDLPELPGSITSKMKPVNVEQ